MKTEAIVTKFNASVAPLNAIDHFIPFGRIKFGDSETAH